MKVQGLGGARHIGNLDAKDAPPGLLSPKPKQSAPAPTRNEYVAALAAFKTVMKAAA